MTEMSLIGRDGKGVFAEGKFELFNGGIVGSHCRGGHGWHFMWFDANWRVIPSNSWTVMLMLRGMNRGVYGKGRVNNN